ncbi:MAG TPA: YciI family protein [Candidatus Polarisedimenticolaceae bacterium]|nr:YciI family protein [Candidatus Polarisedimenticolaceae bacterium]
MQYLLLIYSNESDEPRPGTAAGDAHLNAYMKFTEDVQQRGVMLGGNALESVKTATTVRVRNGKTDTTDGPFAETKEQLGGYYLLDCEDLDEALELAAKIPSAKIGSVEVRPVMRFD